jgi:propionyl-CoA synthetase
MSRCCSPRRPRSGRSARKIRKAAWSSANDLSGFRALFLAGERADPDTIQWAERMLKVPVIDHWWQTETGWTIAGNPMGLGLLPIKHGSPAVPMPGMTCR